VPIEKDHSYSYDISQINEHTPIELLISMLDTFERSYHRILCIRELGKRREKHDLIFSTLENCLISDESEAVQAEAGAVLLRKFPERAYKKLKWAIRNSSFELEHILDENNDFMRIICHQIQQNPEAYTDKLISLAEEKIISSYINHEGLVLGEARALAQLWMDQLKLDPQSFIDVSVSNRYITFLIIQCPQMPSLSLVQFQELRDLHLYCWSDLVRVKDLKQLKKLNSFVLSYYSEFTEQVNINWKLTLFNVDSHKQLNRFYFKELSYEDFQQEPFKKIEDLGSVNNFKYFDIKRESVNSH